MLMIKIFVIDDHHIFRDGIQLLIDSVEDIRLVGDAASGKEALQKLQTVTPDVILMDVQMPDANGIAVTRQVKRLYPNIAVLMLTMLEDDQSLFSAMKAGACGYILKGIYQDDMLGAIRMAASGGAVFSPRMAARMASYFGRMQPNRHPNAPDLSQREIDILNRIAAGDDNVAIAETLHISPKTVRNNVSQLLKKLEATDRLEAANRARNAGLIDY